MKGEFYEKTHHCNFTGRAFGVYGRDKPGYGVQGDPVHSNIVFKIRHILGKVTGIFEKYSSNVVFDPKDLPGSKARLEVTIQVGSIKQRRV